MTLAKIGGRGVTQFQTKRIEITCAYLLVTREREEWEGVVKISKNLAYLLKSFVIGPSFSDWFESLPFINEVSDCNPKFLK